MRQPGRSFSVDMPKPEYLARGEVEGPEGRARLRGEFVVFANTMDGQHPQASADWNFIRANTKVPLRPEEDYPEERRAELIAEAFE